jgi:hypothetical protein
MCSKPRVMYILNAYPQISETYMESEIEALRDEYEIRVITLSKADLAYRTDTPWQYMSDPALIREAVEEFRPQVLHSHWIVGQISLLAEVSRQTGVPFTVRSHSFDVLWQEPSALKRLLGRSSVPPDLAAAIPFLNDDLCLGVLAFPFAVPRLVKAGIHSDKVRGCYPVINYARFHDRSPNGEAVMNMGACLPKKRMEDFLTLAASIPRTEFNLYAMGYDVGKIAQLNESMGTPVTMVAPVEPSEMPREYKKHRWLVLTASREMGTVGWSLSVAEAQASGVGVCFPNLRPDLKEYVGDCGFLYDSIDEVRAIISKPFPDAMRERAFEHARKSDIAMHKSMLTDLWRKAIPSREMRAAR